MAVVGEATEDKIVVNDQHFENSPVIACRVV